MYASFFTVSNYKNEIYIPVAKKCVVLEKAIVKRCDIQGGGCNSKLVVKVLITTVQVNLVPNPMAPVNTNLPKLSLLKFLPLAYHHSHFLAAPLDFTYFLQ